MNFENEIKQVFDIDIWQLKSQYSQENPNDMEALDTPDAVEVKTTVQIDVDNSPVIIHTNELAYSNDIASEKAVNIFIDKSFNLSFLKNITEKLFFKSKVNIYYGSATNSNATDQKGALAINQGDFISQEHSLLSVENKKHILEKLYQYADFKTN